MEFTVNSIASCAIIDVVNEFTVWLNDQLQRKGWGGSELARRAGFSQSLTSDVLNEKAGPSANFVIATANALGEDPVSLLRLAAHLPDAPPATSMDDGILQAFRSLPEPQQNAIATLLSGLAGTAAASSAVESRSGQAAEREREYMVAQPGCSEEGDEMAVSDQEQELRQIFEHQMEALIERIPIEERRTRLNVLVLDWVAKREREAAESRQ